MTCSVHYEDNQGFCHQCSKPMNIDSYAAYVNPSRYHELLASPEFRAKWQEYIDRWEAKNK